VFALLDAYGALARFNPRWNPHTLPMIGGRAQSMFHLAFSVLFAAWWLAGLRNPYLVFGAGAAVVKLAPDLGSGTVGRTLTHPAFGVPTTIDRVDGRLYLPNARFGDPSPDTAA
jgi:hypothetical protein